MIFKILADLWRNFNSFNDYLKEIEYIDFCASLKIITCQAFSMV